MKPYYAERRYVLRILATTLQTDIDGDAHWIYRDENDSSELAAEPTIRRRLAAIRAVIKELERRGAKGPVLR